MPNLSDIYSINSAFLDGYKENYGWPIDIINIGCSLSNRESEDEVLGKSITKDFAPIFKYKWQGEDEIETIEILSFAEYVKLLDEITGSLIVLSYYVNDSIMQFTPMIFYIDGYFVPVVPTEQLDPTKNRIKEILETEGFKFLDFNASSNFGEDYPLYTAIHKSYEFNRFTLESILHFYHAQLKKGYNRHGIPASKRMKQEMRDMDFDAYRNH